MTKVKCIECGKRFEAQRSTAKFCSPNCRVKFNNKQSDLPTKTDFMNNPPKGNILVNEKNGEVEFIGKPKHHLAVDEGSVLPPPIETKQMVVATNGELKTVPSKAAMNRVSETMKMLNKKFGAGTIMAFGDKPQEGYQVISTGSKRLDEAIGIGGLPRGRMVEIMGWESSGKTTIALNVIANAQQQGLKCLYIDAENAFDPEYADALGVEIATLKICQPNNGEEALSVVEAMISAGEVQVVVIDSVAALTPKGEIEDDMGASKMGLHARLMSQACRKLVNIVGKTNTLLVWVNQFRNKIGIVYGSNEVTTGGNALKFYASVRMEVRRSTSEKNSVVGDNGEKEGNQTTVKVIKNKCAPPFKSATFDIIYGKGIVEN